VESYQLDKRFFYFFIPPTHILENALMGFWHKYIVFTEEKLKRRRKSYKAPPHISITHYFAHC